MSKSAKEWMAEAKMILQDPNRHAALIPHVTHDDDVMRWEDEEEF